MDIQKLIISAARHGDYNQLLALIPYAKHIGMRCERFGDELVFILPKNENNLGNPMLPAIHGGVVSGFMETSAMVQLMVFMEHTKVPKVVDFSVDYLRAGHHRDTFCECRITRQGRRVANVIVNCWQSNKKNLIATARAHFLLD